MEYCQNKHNELVVKHLTSALVSGYELDKHILSKNDGTTFIRLCLDEKGTSIDMEDKVFEYLYEQAKMHAYYYFTTSLYGQVEQSPKNQFPRCKKLSKLDFLIEARKFPLLVTPQGLEGYNMFIGKDGKKYYNFPKLSGSLSEEEFHSLLFNIEQDRNKMKPEEHDNIHPL